MRIRLDQKLNLHDDSFTYVSLTGEGPTYRVCSNAYLTRDGEQIGRFKLGDNQWHLYIGDVLKMSGPKGGLFKLPEFELEALTALVNGEL